MIVLIGFICLFALLLIRVPIGFALGLVGATGFGWIVGLSPALKSIGTVASDTVMSYDFAVIPMFILMGNLIARSGISDDLYAASQTWFGGMRRGLAIATIASCGGFSAVCGSSLATAATMARVAVPPMRSYQYSDAVAAGSVAAGGTLGILIPPSIALVLYGIMTESDIGALFAAGVLPGLLGIVLYMAAISVWVRFNPSIGPAAQRASFADKLASLQGIIGILLLFTLVMGGLYLGLFTPTEAAGIGSAGALVIALARGRMNVRKLLDTLYDSARTSVALLTILIGAILFANFMNVARLPQDLGAWVMDMNLSPMMVISMIVLIYVVLGCFLESISMMLLTVPIFYPIVASLGFDLVWFGIVVIVVIEISMITPPVGMNIFVLRSVLPDIPTATIFRGVLPFIAADVIRAALLIAFPIIALWLPNLMH
ncbi:MULTISPECIES: TRAP transporter large permease [Actibacterium]|uniref:TRAP transporter large permease protein n=1 Tax=Actibacterium naphthalenivorans TaxID=1614693 RepID=A0A840CFP1_9RHOB|nr:MULTISPECIES: TRAP transporter large permease [Actibacterium]ALG91494.1 C4-dicarboxylate ABC transporter permease [Actibacterium sp. EMB200-NS6]MBB4022932.1 tripartite ATP-independent transporter DctM subunit [Actibacterium naphthalenivorans]